MVKDVLADEYKLYHLVFAESSVDHSWNRVLFSDDSTFSIAKDVPVQCTNQQTC